MLGDAALGYPPPYRAENLRSYIQARLERGVIPPSLKRGQVLELGEGEVKKLLADFGMDDPAPGRPLRKPRGR